MTEHQTGRAVGGVALGLLLGLLGGLIAGLLRPPSGRTSSVQPTVRTP